MPLKLPNWTRSLAFWGTYRDDSRSPEASPIRGIAIGDCFRFALPNGRWAYCQFVHREVGYGPLVRVFHRITDEPLSSVAEIGTTDTLFPPVFVGLIAAVRHGTWKRIGNVPVHNFVVPEFRQTMSTKPGTYDDWLIWNGRKSTRIGALPIHLRSLELKCVWGSEALAERIVAGTYRGDRMF